MNKQLAVLLFSGSFIISSVVVNDASTESAFSRRVNSDVSKRAQKNNGSISVGGVCKSVVNHVKSFVNTNRAFVIKHQEFFLGAGAVAGALFVAYKTCPDFQNWIKSVVGDGARIKRAKRVHKQN